jgi:ATP diphosphatase
MGRYKLNKINQLLEIMKALRDPQNGCPWDREQTFASLVRHTLEEAYEVAEAIESADYAALADELGDLLFQIVFYARIGEEDGRFDFDTVAGAICEKLTRRHPHVFGDASVSDAAAQAAAWEAHKTRERAAQGRNQGQLSGVALALPALSRASKLQKRAALVGFDWPEIAPVLDKVMEELQEVRTELRDVENIQRIEEEVGDLLFACVNLARHAGVDAESALRKSNRKFEQRFARMEAEVPSHLPLTDLDLAQWEVLWQRAKLDDSLKGSA